MPDRLFPSPTTEGEVIKEDRQRLFLLHRETLWRFVRRLVSITEDADDLLQNVAITLFAHRNGPEDAGAFVGWCCQVARNLAAHHYRSEARRRRRTDDAASFAIPLDVNPETSAMAREQLAEFLEQLNPVAVSLLCDKFVFGETAEEIATRLNVSSASVRMRVARILGVLRVTDANSSETNARARCDPFPRGNNQN
jgi:RNA polymerase sigma factor (sigma-70 family)